MASERIYTIPLRKAFSKAPNWRRTERAVNEIRAFMQHHMKCETVKIGKYLNLEMWSHGRKNPPARIQVKAIKDTVKIKDKDVDVVRVELVNAPLEKKDEQKKSGGIRKPKFLTKKEEVKAEQKKEEREVLEKPLDKKETKTQRTFGQEKDFKQHEQLETKQVDEKLREQKIVTRSQKPTHEKKK